MSEFCATLRRITAERGIALLVASESLTPGGVAAQMWLDANGELVNDRGAGHGRRASPPPRRGIRALIA